MALFQGQSGQKGYGSYSPKKYAQAYKQQRGSYGLGNRQTLGVSNKEYLASPLSKRQTSSFGFPMGGFGGGGRGGAAFAEEDLQRQLEYDKAIWERSTPDVTGVGGQVRWDREKNMLTTSLSPENQAIYDSMIGRQKMFAGNVNSLAGGGWQDAYQQQFDSMRNMYSASDAREEARRFTKTT